MEEQQPHTMRLSSQVMQSMKRLTTLENDVTEAQILIKEASNQQDQDVETIKQEVLKTNVQLASAQKLLEETNKVAGKVMLQLRSLVKHVSVNELEQKIDKVPFEQLITREDFTKMIQQRLQD